MGAAIHGAEADKAGRVAKTGKVAREAKTGRVVREAKTGRVDREAKTGRVARVVKTGVVRVAKTGKQVRVAKTGVAVKTGREAIIPVPGAPIPAAGQDRAPDRATGGLPAARRVTVTAAGVSRAERGPTADRAAELTGPVALVRPVTAPPDLVRGEPCRRHLPQQTTKAR